jgi:hypothetical protein
MRTMGKGEMQRTDRNPMAWVADTLLQQGMPSYEFRSMLRADDFETVRRYLELHRERLGEQLTDHLRAVDRVERVVARRLEHRQVIAVVAGARLSRLLGRCVREAPWI